MIEIPVNELSDDALTAVIEEFITREGTDYGEVEQSLTVKIERLKAQLLAKTAVIIFDPVLSSTHIATAESWAMMRSEGE